MGTQLYEMLPGFLADIAVGLVGGSVSSKSGTNNTLVHLAVQLTLRPFKPHHRC